MSIDDPTVAVKWLGGILAVFTLPFAWMHTRQNRADEAIVKIADSVARMETHYEHIREDINMLKSSQQKRRENFRSQP